WDDPRLAGALSLAVRLTPDWEGLSLMAIYPAPRAREVRGQQRYFAYDLMTRGGTRIVWGAAPDDPAAGEDTFAEKLARLKQCVAQYAALQWTEWPESVDVRHGTIVTPRTAKKLPGESSADDPIIADKPPAADDAPVVK
ncbi:MAG TPA: hypothetical protein PKC18_20020, partial [Lacipirellulaceae bacterium]|nr:hypothetical protein [Lacipirellulaceae bacterium]